MSSLLIDFRFPQGCPWTYRSFFFYPAGGCWQNRSGYERAPVLRPQPAGVHPDPFAFGNCAGQIDWQRADVDIRVPLRFSSRPTACRPRRYAVEGAQACRDGRRQINIIEEDWSCVREARVAGLATTASSRAGVAIIHLLLRRAGAPDNRLPGLNNGAFLL